MYVHLSHVTSARMISPILPPEARYVTMHNQHSLWQKRHGSRSLFAAWMVLTAQISRNAGSEQPARRHGQRAAEVDHAREGAAVEDVEAVLSSVYYHQ